MKYMNIPTSEINKTIKITSFQSSQASLRIETRSDFITKKMMKTVFGALSISEQ